MPRAVVDGKESTPLDRDEDEQSMNHAIFLMLHKAEKATPVIRVELHDLGALTSTRIPPRAVEFLRVAVARLPLS